MSDDVRESSRKNEAVVLTSWKEIAAYLGKGVRTLQRWEQQLDFPLHRPDATRGVVIAFPHEIDAWIKRRSGSSENAQQRLRKLFAEIEALIEINPDVRIQARELCAELYKNVNSEEAYSAV